MRLQFLRLSHNIISGKIPTSITNLECLKCLDIASNGMSGSLPRYLGNLSSMRHKYLEGHHFNCRYSQPVEYRSVTLSQIIKGQQRDYGSVQIMMDMNMTVIDLSSNYFTGEIPEDIATLDAIQSLNISRNYFSRNVPKNIGAMQRLESLDLSWNNLAGEIPSSLSDLTFLSYLDLSYNNFTGRIPSGSQLDTLFASNPSMYTGNIGLCGAPLKKNCSSNKLPHLRRTEKGNGPEMFYLGLGCGFILGTWMVFSALLLMKGLRMAYFHLFDKLYDKVYVFVVVTWARLAMKTVTE